MSINKIIWIMWFYIAVQYIFSRYVAIQINKADPTYFDFPDGKFPFGMKASLGITEMMFDADLPEQEYEKTLKTKIYVARIIFGLTIPLLIVLVLI